MKPSDELLALIEYRMRAVSIGHLALRYSVATAYYPGSAVEAESALAYVIYLANKGLAHTTSNFTKHDEGTRLLEIAFRGVPTLISNRFYVASGIAPPEHAVRGRARAA